MALACGLPPRNLRPFLSLHKRDDALLRGLVQQITARERHDPDSVLILDETYHASRGQDPRRAAAVVRDQGDHRQLSGHGPPGVCGDGLQTLQDRELFLPESLVQDRQRCHAAGVPDDLTHQTKWVIALAMIDRSRGNGVFPCRLTFDAGYGMVTDSCWSWTAGASCTWAMRRGI